MKNILIIIFCIFFNAMLAKSMLVSVKNYDSKLLNKIKTSKKEICLKTRNQIDFFCEQAFLPELTSYNYTVIQNNEDLALTINSYHSYIQVKQMLENYANTYPEICKLISLGTTTCADYYAEGKHNYYPYRNFEILCLKISDNPLIEENEPNVFIGGGIHSRELISVEVTLAVIENILQNYDSSQSVQQSVNNNQMWFVPIINPDGHYVVKSGVNINKRKNMRDNNNNEIPDSLNYADGVDLNRNFGYVWGSNGTSPYSNNQLYNGPFAFSEKETKIIKNLFEQRRYWGAITYHSYAQKVLFPLGHLPNVNSIDRNIMLDLATSMAVTIPKVNANGINISNYQSMQAVDFGYTCQGTMGDWSYAEKRIFGFTIELSYTYIPPVSIINQICQNNIQAAMMFIDRPSKSCLTGTVTDEFGNPIKAEMKIIGLDDASNVTRVEPYLTGKQFGEFYRPLLTGTYNIEFSCKSFNNANFTNVHINNENATNLNVVLTRQKVEDVTITKSQNSVSLNWDSEPDDRFIVYSSKNANKKFSPDSFGYFSQPNVWHKNVSGLEKEFYLVYKLAN